jgi:hypothetical protein
MPAFTTAAWVDALLKMAKPSTSKTVQIAAKVNTPAQIAPQLVCDRGL